MRLATLIRSALVTCAMPRLCASFAAALAASVAARSSSSAAFFAAYAAAAFPPSVIATHIIIRERLLFGRCKGATNGFKTLPKWNSSGPSFRHQGL